MNIKKYKFVQNNRFKITNFKTNDKGEFSSREEAVEEFISNLKEIHTLQQKLYAERKESVIFIFQAMDAAGKDGTIRTVFSTLSPHGVKEFCFKAPSSEELAHDYLWRFWSALPAKGHISIFNRSYYEDVLIGKVHKLYEKQLVPDRLKDVDVIQKRYDEINNFEKYLYNNGTRVVKIFLNVSKKEQAKRFISRIDTPSKNWKISEGDIKEREYWDEYQEAFESMINKTSSNRSPWYVVPADHKWYARLIVSRIVLNTLREIDPQFPTVSADEVEKIQKYREELINSLDKKPKKNKNKIKNKFEDENTSIDSDVLKSNETCTIKQRDVNIEDTDNVLLEQENTPESSSKKENDKKHSKSKHKKHKKGNKNKKSHEKEKNHKHDCDCDCNKDECNSNKECDCNKKCNPECENNLKPDDKSNNIPDSSNEEANDRTTDSVFFDASTIVTDNIIEEEQAKALEKEKEKEKEEDENKIIDKINNESETESKIHDENKTNDEDDNPNLDNS